MNKTYVNYFYEKLIGYICIHFSPQSLRLILLLGKYCLRWFWISSTFWSRGRVESGFFFFLEGIIFLFILGSTFQKFHYLHFELSERVERGHFFPWYLKPTFSKFQIQNKRYTTFILTTLFTIPSLLKCFRNQWATMG